MIDPSQIETMVMTRFPVTENEKKCLTERTIANEARQAYRKKLYEQYKTELNEHNQQTNAVTNANG